MLHIIEYFKSLWLSLKERVDNPFQAKTTTPFGSAFFIYLVLYNWVLIYSVLTFDNSTSLNQRVLFIRDYLQHLNVIQMLVLVTGYAYLSIVLFYLTTNISLIITLIFKKIRIWILSNLERNKLVAIEEFKRVQDALKNLRSENSEVRKQLEESEMGKKSVEEENNSLRGVVDKTKVELENSTKMFEELESKHESLNRKFIGLVANHAKFKLISAYYGVEGYFINVKDIIEKELEQNNQVEVMNKTFQVDPIKGQLKRLEVTFEMRGGIQSAVFQEYDTLVLNENGLIIQSSLINAQEKGNINTNASSLFEMMPENWQLEFTKDGNSLFEDVFISRENDYSRNGVLAFRIRNFRNIGAAVSFDKYNLDGSLHANEDLVKLSDIEFIGVDSLGYRLVYRKKD